MNILTTWYIPSAKTFTIALTDVDGNPVTLASHSQLRISATINQVEVKKFALSGDAYSANVVAAVAGYSSYCEVAFTSSESEAFKNGLLEFNVYKIRGTIIDRELISVALVKNPAV
jgi:hypothetical protein